MTDRIAILDSLRRPSLLVRAARAGLPDYDRNRALPRLFCAAGAPAPDAAIDTLLEEETELEQTRRTGSASYSISRHVDVMIALMAEARLLPKRLAT